jgi:PelA/Pel-15E family pectate lyase
MNRLLRVLFAVLLGFSVSPARSDDDIALAAEAEQALRQGCRFFHEQVSTAGGYLWQYSSDLERREGEGRADAQTVWVQPPGTPSVGLALLEAYRETGAPYLLEMACDAGRCLVRGQLQSGGWDYRIEFDPSRRRRYAYRADPDSQGGRNVSTLDDNTTQAALRLLVELDRELDFADEAIHRSATSGLAALRRVQYPNGAWPQRFEGPPESPPAVRQAAYPDTWPREFPARTYTSFYTFNDNTIADTIDLMFLAARVYGNADDAEAARRGGDFILLAQMPEPQPGWAQQYDAEMHPAWARKFEPPSITGGESAGILRTLMRVYRETGDRKYLEPIPRALDYYRDSVLPDGRLARFYELRTNRPLYFTREYQLTYDDSDLPTHYSFQQSNWVPSVTREFQALSARDPASPPVADRPRAPRRPNDSLRRQVRQVIAGQDERGAWCEPGRLKTYDQADPTEQVISCRTLIRNVGVLSGYLAAVRTDGAGE